MRNSQQTAYVEFVRVVSPRLLAIAWLLTGDRHRAEELVQEALVRVYVAWRRVRPDTASAYARTVLVNLHTEQWRRRRREVLVDEVPDASGGDTRLPDVERLELSLDMVSALQLLAPRERQAVVLRHYADLSEKATAEAMSCSTGNVKALTSRGLQALRQNLTEEGDSHALV